MKAILTGLGGRGLHWLSAMRQRDDIEQIVFVEPYEGSITRAVEQYGVPREHIFPNLDAAIAAGKADFVLDVTPPAVHHEVALKAFEHGLHVIGEKPLSDNFQRQKRGRGRHGAGFRHMITQNYRFSAQPRTTRPLLEQGLIGKPAKCDIRFYMPWADSAGTHYVTEPYMLINDMMVHHFDMMRYVLAPTPSTCRPSPGTSPGAGTRRCLPCHRVQVRLRPCRAPTSASAVKSANAPPGTATGTSQAPRAPSTGTTSAPGIRTPTTDTPRAGADRAGRCGAGSAGHGRRVLHRHPREPRAGMHRAGQPEEPGHGLRRHQSAKEGRKVQLSGSQ